MAIDNLNPGDSVSASDWNSLVDAAQKPFTVTPPLELLSTPSGNLLRIQGTGLYAKITAKGSVNGFGKFPYSWTQVDPDGNGGWVTTPSGLTGTASTNPAYEVNNQTVTINNVVSMVPGLNSEWWFAIQTDSGVSPIRDVVLAVSCNFGQLQVTTETWTFTNGDLTAVQPGIITGIHPTDTSTVSSSVGIAII